MNIALLSRMPQANPFRQLLFPVASLIALLLLVSTSSAQVNGLLREVYTGIPGEPLSNLKSHPSYPNSPTQEEVITSGFETPSNIGDNYGQRVSGYLVPPITGTYTFWIATDDAGELWLSSDVNPANKVLIASVSGWTASREYFKEANQQSAPISLVAGQRYYIEALHKEGAGGDNLAVAWRRPGDPPVINGSDPISLMYLQPAGQGPPVVAQHPTNRTVFEGASTTFTVVPQRASGVQYQWQRNGANLPGATNASYTIPAVTLADNGFRFRAILTNPQGSTNSNEALLTVQADNIRPVLISAGSLGNNQQLSVVFSEVIDPATGTNRNNYTLNNGATIQSAVLGGDGRSIILYTSTLSNSAIYTLTVNNVRDRATVPNTILANSQVSFSLDFPVLDISHLIGSSETIGPSSRRTGLILSEIMYHPTNRPDLKNLEYIELFNTQDWPEDISGFRLSGSVDFVFPTNTVINARSFMVVAPVPADLQSVYGIAGVRGGFTNLLGNSSGTVRLRNRSGAVLLEASYSGDPPYSVAADGGGHSLVLARPSYGERDPRAWAASELRGGSPGGPEPAASNPFRTVLINEFLTHTDPPLEDFIELYNYGASPVNLSGCILTDDPTTNRYVFTNTTIPAKGFVVVLQSQLNFALSAGGEDIFLISSNKTKIIDSVRFGAKENGISTGRFPDGNPLFSDLSQRTEGAANASPLLRGIVINEIMYNPISGLEDDEYLELFNRGTAAINLGGWRLIDGISYTFPTNATVAPGGYLVVAKNAARLLTNYPNLNSLNTFGNYRGALANGGERIALTMPEDLVTTNNGVRVTNLVHVVVDEVAYFDGGRWGQWSDGGGSSLELIDPDSENRLPSNWADSNESSKAAWTTIEHTGVLDHGNGAIDEVQLFMQGAGEALVDNVEVFPVGGANAVINPGFESGMTGWIPQGNQDRSFIENSGYTGTRSLHLVGIGRGDPGANRVRSTLSPSLSPGGTATLRAKVRWLRGHPEMLLRVHGNWLEAIGAMALPANLGSPGAVNSRALNNAGPAIHSVSHFPVLPAGNQAVTVRAQVDDPDGIGSLVLNYRIDPATNLNAAAMVYNGAGLFSAIIPGQPAGGTVAFFIQAGDAFSPSASSRFPADAPAREALIRFGEQQPTGNFGTYRIWITQNTLNRWSSRLKLDNGDLDATFVHGNQRVIYNIGTLYSGSPWISPGYNSPIGNLCGYVLHFAPDDPFLGNTDFVLDWPIRDATTQLEQIAYWMADQLNVPFNYRRFINLYVNGNRRGSIYEDTQQPNSDFIDQWFPDDTDGDLHKIEDWFEFDDGASKEFNVDATLQNFTTTGGAKKLARYRWNWRKRATESPNNYTNLFRLVDAVNAGSPEPYTSLVNSLVDVEEWMRIFAVEHIAGNWDSYGYNRGKNMYTYKPEEGRWNMMMWDIDFVFSAGGDGPTTPLFNTIEPVIGRMYNHPPFRRAYYQALQDAVDGPMLATRVNPVMDARYAALLNNGIGVSSPSVGKTYIQNRRNYILTELNNVASPFAITSNGGIDYSTNNNLLRLSGTAPIQVKYIEINSNNYPVTWLTLHNWVVTVPLVPGTNTLSVQGLNNRSNLVAGSSDIIRVNYTGPFALPENSLVINEIMYNPAAPDGSYLEIYNSSTNTAFDLSNYRLDGADFIFPEGSSIPARGFLLVVKSLQSFINLYGTGLPVAGEFSGQLDNGGETLRLTKPGATPLLDLVVDEVTYDDAAPWPLSADGMGPSLQLRDALQDNNRVANWGVSQGVSPYTPGVANSIRTNLLAFPTLRINEVQSQNSTGLVDRFGEREPWLEIFNHGTSPVNLGGFYLSTNYTNLGLWAFPSNAVVNPGQFLVVFADGEPGESLSTELHTSFRLNPTNSSLALSQRINNQDRIVDYLDYQFLRSDISFGSFPDGRPGGRQSFFYVTPGGTNNPSSGAADVFINEWMAQNTGTITDPADGDFDDWFELFNTSSNSVDISGFILTDEPGNFTKFTVPNGTIIPPGGYLLVWADNELTQNSSNRIDLHAGFQLAQGGETLVLYAPDRRIVDSVAYTNAGMNISQGRFPDASPLPYFSMTNWTPRAPNVLSSSNSAPVIVGLGNKTINEGAPFSFSITATDSDEGQVLTFALVSGPPGASLNAQSGLFTWTPNETHGGTTVNVTVRVSDNGAPVSSDTETFSIEVYEFNQAPTLSPVPTQTVFPGGTLVVTNVANDDDLPANRLTYSLAGTVLPGFSINSSNGIFRWVVPVTQPEGSNFVTVVVSDDGVPMRTNAMGFTVLVTGRPRFIGTGLLPDRRLSITWQSLPNINYRVEYVSQITASNWSILHPNVPSQGAITTTNDTTTTQPMRFYRVVEN